MSGSVGSLSTFVQQDYTIVKLEYAPELQFRCDGCAKLLARANKRGAIAGEIKCPRCGRINET